MNADMLKDLLAAATPGPWGYSQCSCGHPSCNQQIMDNQGNVGFSEPDARLIALAPQLAADNIALQAEVENLRDLLSKCVGILDATIEESKRDIEYGEEDPFRMGEWFEEDDMIALEAARTALNETREAQP